MPLFNFSLHPLDEVQPWGNAPNLSLHYLMKPRPLAV
jgi:hypothetical protein